MAQTGPKLNRKQRIEREILAERMRQAILSADIRHLAQISNFTPKMEDLGYALAVWATGVLRAQSR